MKKSSRLMVALVFVALSSLLLMGTAFPTHEFPWGGVVTGAGAGGGPHVRQWDHDGTEINGMFAYAPAFGGGVRVAVDDLTGDGWGDIVTGAGPGGGSHVRAFNGTNLEELAPSFYAYASGFSGGVYVATGLCEGPFLVTGAGPGGGPHVRVWRLGLDDGGWTPTGGFFAYADGFAGGVRVATGDVDDDGCDEIITGAGPGGGAHVRVFNNTAAADDFSPLGGFFAYNNFSGGVFVAGGEVTCDGRSDIITGPGAGMEPLVRVFPGSAALDFPADGSFLAYAAGFTGGVTVAAQHLRSTCAEHIITGAGPGGGPHVRTFSGIPLGVPDAGWFAYDGGFGGGVFVSGSTQTVTAP